MADRRFFDSIASTQELAIELARSGAEPGTRVVAATQTAGVGREDHRWASPRGGLYLSWIGPDVGVSGPFASIALGAGLAELMRTGWRAPVVLRWPNDLVVDDGGVARKIAGVLPDRVARAGGARMVVGVGLNVRSAPSELPPELHGRVAQLSEFVDPPPLGSIEDRVVAQLEAVTRQLVAPDGPGRWLATARRLLYGRGRRVRRGSEALGTIEGLAEDGALQIGTPRGIALVRDGGLQIEAGA